MKTVIRDVIVVSIDEKMNLFDKGYVIIEDDTIIEVDSMDNYKKRIEGSFLEEVDVEIIDGESGILMPGMINLHTHLGMIPFRSLADDYADRLKKYLFPLEAKCMNVELTKAASKYAMAELLLGGVTTFLDMYYFEDEVAKVAETMKMRSFLGETIINFPAPDSKEPYGGFEVFESLVKKYQNHPLITPVIAPHAPYTNSDEMLKKASDLAKKYDLLFSMHIDEMTFEVAEIKEKYNMSVVEYLDSLNILNEKVIAAHMVLTPVKDIEILKQRNVKVAHNIGANTKGAKGIALIKQMVDNDVVVGLGSDGPSSGNTIDILTQMPLVGKNHKVFNQDRTLFPAKEIVKMATINGAKALGIDNIVGSIEVGKKADLVLLETKSVNMYPIHNPYSVIVYSANPSNVESVWVNGKRLVANKKLMEHDLTEIRNELESLMQPFYDATNSDD